MGVGGGGQILPPRLTRERVAVARRESGTRYLSTSTSQFFFDNFLKEDTSQVNIRLKVKIVTFRLIGYRVILISAVNQNFAKRLPKG